MGQIELKDPVHTTFSVHNLQKRPPSKVSKKFMEDPCISRIINIDEDNTVLIIGVSLSYMRIVCTRIVLALCVKKRDLRIDPWMTIQFIQSNMLTA